METGFTIHIRRVLKMKEESNWGMGHMHLFVLCTAKENIRHGLIGLCLTTKGI